MNETWMLVPLGGAEENSSTAAVGNVDAGAVCIDSWSSVSDTYMIVCLVRVPAAFFHACWCILR